MDLIIYLVVMAAIGLIKMNTSSDAVSTLLNNPGEVVSEVCTLPIGRNLSLLKEKDAYTLILEELGLK